MLTPKFRHSPSGSRPRPLYLAAMLVFVGLLTALTPIAAFALPKDPIDPPDFGGDVPYTPPAGGFDWSVPARFGGDANGDGLIDYFWRDSNDPNHPNTYDPSHIYPDSWPINLDGCQTDVEEGAGTSSNVYIWQVQGKGALVAYSWSTPNVDPDRHRCRFQKPDLPAQGDYTVRLTIYDTNTGTKIAPADHDAYQQDVYIKDYLIVSIGDSFASGQGNPDIPQRLSAGVSGPIPVAPAIWEDTRCNRSAVAGPAQAALDIERRDRHTSVTFLSFACSGATVERPVYDPVMLMAVPPFINLDPDPNKPNGSGILGRYRGAQVPNGFPYPPNNSAVNSFEPYLPSQIDQLRTALTPPAGQSPRRFDALIMSAGGNDIYFGDIAQACVISGSCWGSTMLESPGNGPYTLETLVRRELGVANSSPADNLPAAYHHLSDAINGLTVNGVSVSPAHIYITQYPDLARDDNGNYCRMLDDIFWPNPLLAIDTDESRWAEEFVLASLNNAVQTAAGRYGWTFVDGMASYVNDPTTPVPMVRGPDGKGHGYCASDNWIRRADEAELLQGPVGWRMLTKGTLHPAARAHQIYKDRILHYMAPDLAAELPTPPPVFDTSLTVGTYTDVAGSNGWFLKSCTGGGSCQSKVVLKVTAIASDNPTVTLRGGSATATTNGANACVAGVVSCTGPTPSADYKTATWTYTIAADGIYQFSFAARDSTGQTADFAYQIKADLHDPQLTAPAPLSVDEGGSVALQAQASDAGGGLVDIDWDLNHDGTYETTAEQPNFSAATFDGPATQTIGVRATDAAGRVATATTTINILNVAPTAGIDVPPGMQEGSPITLNSHVVDPGYNEQFTYAWQATRNGVAVAASNAADFSFTPADSGSYVVNLTVSDDDGGTGTATQTIDVANVPPAPGMSSPPAANQEGTAINLTASATDPSFADASAGFTYAWTVNKGTATFATGAGDHFSFTPDDNGSYVVSVAATDKDGGTGTASQTISVANVAPTLSNLVVSAATVNEGGSVTLTGNISDPGSADTFTVEINWGDGSAAQTVSRPAGSTSFSVAHTYLDDNPTGTASDLNTISVKLSDDDGASDTKQASVTVNNQNPAVTITGPSETALFAVTAPINVSATFTDAGAGDTWSCQITWDDGTVTAGTVAAGTCTASKTYAGAGVYTIQVKVTDDDGGWDAKTVMIVVYDPSAGFVTGSGFIDSPAGAFTADPSLAGRARFAFVSKYQKGAQVPTGETQFEFKAGDFKFESTAYQWLVVSGPKAQYKGTGTVNGGGSYGFLLTLTDGQVKGGGNVDKFRIKIWNGAGVVYDNVVGAPDDMNAANPQAIAIGSIVIH